MTALHMSVHEEERATSPGNITQEKKDFLSHIQPSAKKGEGEEIGRLNFMVGG